MNRAMSQVLFAPSEEASTGVITVFLAGTTTKVDKIDWRDTVTNSLLGLPITIYNPHRPDWDSSWQEDISYPPFRNQVLWELDKQEKADIVVFYFHPATTAMVSLLEFGLSARAPGKSIVVCPEGYCKRGNVQLVCEKFGVQMVEKMETIQQLVRSRVLASG
ncbi:hypothetical protein BGW36DRAFT_379748 [Talaromyces proteolyticus]|uniref:Uncharacterized protein n=1 Tax=Talaromyces proteolyticus TaxID=1131652 RepID=A0AAD4KTK1_9EURO|nr:uncharacterized protein BGW36DRAFT_379748 [Talaromyces proteolyticus]KAH8697962.1 hypothetical protein BGW36DRAFT_379748 [Talaromyces proteolyticus]